MDGAWCSRIDYGDEMNLCACMGPMYGEPYCYCQMKQRGLEYFMDNNPVRIEAASESAARCKRLWEPGGWFYENAGKGDEVQ